MSQIDHNLLTNTAALERLAENIQQWGRELGFAQIGITDCELDEHRADLEQWLEKGYHGTMEWMVRHKDKRGNPSLLLPGTLRVISARMEYLPENTEQIKVLKQADKAYISRYALGRDYHKVIRKRLAKLAERIREQFHTIDTIIQRPFVDSAPVLEKALAEKAGLGWIGKNTLVINAQAGSWFFLGEIYTNIPLPINSTVAKNQCGECSACLKVCPTDAFVDAYQLDAKRCISYLTIENKGSIPLEFREPMGNRVFGCDDCQIICPWNKFAKPTAEPDFSPRHSLDNSDLVTLFLWTEAEYLDKTEGSPIRRIGYNNWLRNLSVGLGNANPSEAIVSALNSRLNQHGDIVDEHILWALERQTGIRGKRKRKIKRND